MTVTFSLDFFGDVTVRIDVGTFVEVIEFVNHGSANSYLFASIFQGYLVEAFLKEFVLVIEDFDFFLKIKDLPLLLMANFELPCESFNEDFSVLTDDFNILAMIISYGAKVLNGLLYV